MVHDLIARPLTCTMHAPHWVVSHPTCVPVRPSFSRRNSTSIIRSSTAPRASRPFTIMDTSRIGAAAVFDGLFILRVFDRLPDSHRCHGHRYFSHAERRERIQNGVANPRGGSGRGAPAERSRAKRVESGAIFRWAGFERG